MTIGEALGAPQVHFDPASVLEGPTADRLWRRSSRTARYWCAADALDNRTCTAERIHMTAATTGPTETWQARIGHELAAQLRRDAELLGLEGRTEIVKAALELLHRRAAEERMGRSVDEFYGDGEPPLPLGVRMAHAAG